MLLRSISVFFRVLVFLLLPTLLLRTWMRGQALGNDDLLLITWVSEEAKEGSSSQEKEGTGRRCLRRT